MRVFAILIGLSLATANLLGAQPAATRPLVITFSDVGQGDASLIVTPEGKHILIDAGPSARAAERMFFEWVADTLDLVVASHNHADHIGGMPWVFSRFVVRAHMENGIPHTTGAYAGSLHARRNEPGLLELEPTRRTIRVGSATLRILPPSGVDNSQNNNSVGILLEYGSFRALFPGDAESEQLAHWMKTLDLPRVNVLKVSHHGAFNGTTEEWIRTTSPGDVVISVSGTNGHGHPALSVLRAWQAARANVFRTDVEGSVQVVVHPDGKYDVLTTNRNTLWAPIRP